MLNWGFNTRVSAAKKWHHIIKGITSSYMSGEIVNEQAFKKNSVTALVLSYFGQVQSTFKLQETWKQEFIRLKKNSIWNKDG